MTPTVRTWLTADSLDDADLGNIGTHGDGAVLIFQGRVRDRADGRGVLRLEYEVYEDMAEVELRRICEEVASRHDVGAIVAAHRTGALEPGEVSVTIGVAAPHRDVCYAASREVIEEIKLRLPVWKHEHYADGESVWVGVPISEGES